MLELKGMAFYLREIVSNMASNKKDSLVVIVCLDVAKVSD